MHYTTYDAVKKEINELMSIKCDTYRYDRLDKLFMKVSKYHEHNEFTNRQVSYIWKHLNKLYQNYPPKNHSTNNDFFLQSNLCKTNTLGTTHNYYTPDSIKNKLLETELFFFDRLDKKKKLLDNFNILLFNTDSLPFLKKHSNSGNKSHINVTAISSKYGNDNDLFFFEPVTNVTITQKAINKKHLFQYDIIWIPYVVNCMCEKETLNLFVRLKQFLKEKGEVILAIHKENNSEFLLYNKMRFNKEIRFIEPKEILNSALTSGYDSNDIFFHPSNDSLDFYTILKK